MDISTVISSIIPVTIVCTLFPKTRYLVYAYICYNIYTSPVIGITQVLYNTLSKCI